MAEKGEFSKQAFFNSKINLTQANAINDLIRSPSSIGVKIAMRNLDPEKQKIFEEIEEKIISIIANIKVNIDYPEYDGVKYIEGKEVKEELLNSIEKLKVISKISEKAKIFQNGVKVAIIGKPNAGKSTLLNALIKEEKAIVSHLKGTTRDFVEGNYMINNIPITLVDTAGIRKTKNWIESQGVKRSFDVLKRAEFVFFVVNANEKWDEENNEILKKIIKEKKEYFLILNKKDLKENLKIPENLNIDKIVKISAKKKDLAELEKLFSNRFSSNFLEEYQNLPLFSNSWQKAKLDEIIEKMTKTLILLDEKEYLDAVCGDLEIIFRMIKELNGKNYDEEILDIIFSRFCLGK